METNELINFICSPIYNLDAANDTECRQISEYLLLTFLHMCLHVHDGW